MQGEGNQSKCVSIQGLVSKNVIREEEKSNRDESKINMEIEEVEKEISRLSSRLEALRLEKADRRLKSVEKRGRIVLVKFMEPKQNVKIEEPLLSSSKTKISRRGVSLGPAEIYSGAKSRFLSKQEITPVSKQSRRKSCFWDLEEIDELKVIKERGKSFSVSPRSRKTVSKIQAQKQAAATVGSNKRPTKKEDTVFQLIRPKTLFKDGDKSAPSKKMVKPGRVVASRYSQIPTNQINGKLTASEAQKGSLPDSDKEERNKRIASRCKGAIQKADDSCRSKKKKIPDEVDVGNTDTVEDPPSSVFVIAEVFPKDQNQPACQ